MEIRIPERLSGRQLKPMPKFVIFGQGRSGSELLTHLLNCSPHVRCDGEILDAHRAHSERYVRLRRARSLGLAYGYKVKIYQLTEEQGVDDVGGWLRAQHRAGWQIVSLKRYNVVRQVVSNVAADQQGGQFHRTDDRPRPPLVIDPDAILEYGRRRQRHGAAEDRALAGVPHLPLTYEDDLADPESQQRTLDRLLDTLGLPRVKASVSLRRTNPGSLDAIVANAGEVRAALAGTEFAAMWD